MQEEETKETIIELEEEVVEEAAETERSCGHLDAAIVGELCHILVSMVRVFAS